MALPQGVTIDADLQRPRAGGLTEGEPGIHRRKSRAGDRAEGETGFGELVAQAVAGECPTAHPAEADPRCGIPPGIAPLTSSRGDGEAETVAEQVPFFTAAGAPASVPPAGLTCAGGTAREAATSREGASSGTGVVPTETPVAANGLPMSRVGAGQESAPQPPGVLATEEDATSGELQALAGNRPASLPQVAAPEGPTQRFAPGEGIARAAQSIQAGSPADQPEPAGRAEQMVVGAANADSPEEPGRTSAPVREGISKPPANTSTPLLSREEISGRGGATTLAGRGATDSSRGLADSVLEARRAGDSEARQAAQRAHGAGGSQLDRFAPGSILSAAVGASDVSTAVPGGSTGDLVEQVVRHARLLSYPDRTELTVQLEPEILGRIRLRLVLQDGQIALRVVADDAQVQSALQAGLDQLREGLQSRGIASGVLDASGEGASSHMQHDAPGNRPDPGAPGPYSSHRDVIEQPGPSWSPAPAGQQLVDYLI